MVHSSWKIQNPWSDKGMAAAWERKSQALITNSSKSKTRTTYRASPEEAWGPRRAERASVSAGFTTSQSCDLGKSDGHSEPQLPLFSSGRAKLGLWLWKCLHVLPSCKISALFPWLYENKVVCQDQMEPIRHQRLSWPIQQWKSKKLHPRALPWESAWKCLQ